MRFIKGDLIYKSGNLYVIEYSLRDKYGKSTNNEFKAYLVENYDGNTILKGKPIFHFIINSKCKLIKRTRPDLLNKNIKHDYKIGQILKDNYNKEYEIVKIDNGLIYIKSIDSYINYTMDFTIGELIESEYKLVKTSRSNDKKVIKKINKIIIEDEPYQYNCDKIYYKPITWDDII